jgi:deazaflavin-dependent oxidoreductase (nitroreductase family)
MPTKKEIIDSPTGWVKSHIKEYVESDGKKGHRWRGYPTLLLTTRGRKTGQLRRTALIYGQDKGRYLVVASNGGADKHPLWYLNLLDNPEVHVQIGAEKFMAHARPATAREKPRLWRLMNGVYPTYDSYQERASKADRQIPVIILEPIAHE